MEVALDLRTESGWASLVLQGAEAALSILAFGLKCAVAELYERTPMQPRRMG